MQITDNVKIKEIVKENYQTAQVFENNHIDFCCGGDVTLTTACQQAGVDYSQLVSELEQAMQVEDWDARYINNMELDSLCDYIIQRHHAYVRDKIPFIEQKLEKLCCVHGDNHPELFEIQKLFEGAVSNLSSHMKDEEDILFPYIRKMVSSKQGKTDSTVESGNIRKVVDVMFQEHQTEGDRFKKIAELSGNYAVPGDGCNTYEVTWKTLDAFEKDLHRHIHIENNVLFPRAVELDKQLNLSV